MTTVSADHYNALLGEIKKRIRSAQYEALKSVVERLAEDLQVEFPGIGGFSARNIWRIRIFYLTYKDNEKLTPLVAEIGWRHNLVIMERCKDGLQREFYIRIAGED